MKPESEEAPESARELVVSYLSGGESDEDLATLAKRLPVDPALADHLGVVFRCVRETSTV